MYGTYAGPHLGGGGGGGGGRSAASLNLYLNIYTKGSWKVEFIG